MSDARATEPREGSLLESKPKKLHVGNLSYAVNEEQLKQFFETAGHKVMSVHMPRDRDSGSPRGFAFLEFETLEAARAAATDLAGKKLGGRPLQIGESRKATGIEAERAAAKKRPPRKGPPRKGPPQRGRAKPPIVVKRGGPRNAP